MCLPKFFFSKWTDAGYEILVEYLENPQSEEAEHSVSEVRKGIIEVNVIFPTFVTSESSEDVSEL